MTTSRLRLTRLGAAVTAGTIGIAFASGYRLHEPSVGYSIRPVAAHSCLQEVLADPFAEENHGDLLDGCVIAYHSVSQDRLAIVFYEVHGSSDPSGPRVRMTMTCSGREIYLGILAQRFFNGAAQQSARNSLVIRSVKECESVTLSVIRADGSVVDSTVIKVALDGFRPNFGVTQI